MFTEELYIMDRNMERLMVSELQDKVDVVKTERDVFRLRLKGKTSEEIAGELSISIERVNEILEESNQGSQN